MDVNLPKLASKLAPYLAALLKGTSTTVPAFPNAIDLPEIATPATPASGYGRVYFKSDGALYTKNDAGNEYLLGWTTDGTFTPGFAGDSTAGSWTYSIQTGFYHRIGTLVFAWGSLAAASRPSAPTGNAIITGLPFTSASGSNRHIPVTLDSISNIDLLATTKQLTARIPPNATRIEFVENPDNASVSFLPATSFGASSIIRFSGWYTI